MHKPNHDDYENIIYIRILLEYTLYSIECTLYSIECILYSVRVHYIV